MTELLHVRAYGWVLPLMLMAPATSMAQSQNPSPMQETTRAHERLERLELRGVVDSLSGPGSAMTRIFIPDHDSTDDVATLVIHFHGAAWIEIGRASCRERG